MKIYTTNTTHPNTKFDTHIPIQTESSMKQIQLKITMEFGCYEFFMKKENVLSTILYSVFYLYLLFTASLVSW